MDKLGISNWKFRRKIAVARNKESLGRKVYASLNHVLC